jgi:hypothetical protein
MRVTILCFSLAVIMSCRTSNQAFYTCSFGQVLDNSALEASHELLDSSYLYNDVEGIVKTTFKNIYYNYFGLDTAKVFVEHSNECRIAAADIDLRNGHFKKKLLYNKKALEEIYTAYGNTWAIRAIIAHEVSHIVNVDKLYRDKAVLNEIWADYFAGLHMRRMGALEAEATQPFEVMAYAVTPGYPTRDERVQLVKLGWKNGSLKSDCEQSILSSITKSQAIDRNSVNALSSIHKDSTHGWNKIDVFASDVELYITPKNQVVAVDTIGAFTMGTLKHSNIKPFNRVIEESGTSAVWFVDELGKIYDLSEHGIVPIGKM